jgi:hypothetical protein
VLIGAVNGVEAVAVGALQFTRGVLVSAVSGAASLGAEAVTGTVAGARGVVSAASRVVGDLAGSARTTFREALDSVGSSAPGPGRVPIKRPLARMAGRRSEAGTQAPVPTEPTARSRGRTGRRPGRRGRPTIAA